MLIPRILAVASVVAYLLAMCLPAVAVAPKSYPTTYLFYGWVVTYICGSSSFAPSMDLGERAPFIVGTISNLLFLFCITLFLLRVFWHRSWPHFVVICCISAVCLVFSVVSVSLAGKLIDGLLVGFYLWILSPILLLLGAFRSSLPIRRGVGP